MGFKRCPMNSADIIYTSKISLMDALDSKSITIVNLENNIEIVRWWSDSSPLWWNNKSSNYENNLRKRIWERKWRR